MIRHAIINTLPRMVPRRALPNSFADISLTDPSSQLPWNHIVTKNIGGPPPLHIPKEKDTLADGSAVTAPGHTAPVMMVGLGGDRTVTGRRW
jgi:hypothetical protein